MSEIVLTQEQKDIIEYVKTGNNLRINARAGSGKTSSLVAVAKAIPKSALYLAFNKAMVEEAKTKFPGYVAVKTWHSLAYAAFGADMAHKLKRPGGVYQNVCGTGREIGLALKLKNLVVNENAYLSSSAMGLAVKNTLRKFESSDDTKITKKHVDYSVASKFENNGKLPSSFPKDKYVKIVLEGAEKLWKKRIDLTDNTLATHDTYLKLYQLSDPVLEEYDIIYSDESQDSSDVMIDILKKQKAQIIVVGDSFQQIYSFRGSINAMNKFDYHTLSLTKSFRFGQDIASVASTIIGDVLTGNEEKQSVVLGSIVENDPTGKTIIYRSNSNMLFDACSFVAKGLIVNIETDVRSVISLLRSAVALRAGDMKNVKNEELSPFNSWEEFEQDCKEGRGSLSHILSIIKSGRAMEIIGFGTTYKKSDDPDVILTTIHKAKGLDWDHVILAGDFNEPKNDEERNLLYVAATRSKMSLQMNSILENLLFDKRQKGLTINVKSVNVISPGIGGEVFLDNLRKQADVDIIEKLSECGDVESQDKIIDMCLEDGMSRNSIPQEILMMPDINLKGAFK